jgi:pSer/pThr/pTyr-binding forkhead associated (FHA) protein
MTRYTPRVTPRATPVAQAPASQVTPIVEPATKPALRAPIVVVALDRECELASGSLTIGRLPTTDIPLDDTLVSRIHARIGVADDGTIVVEDLHSTNGVYVNGLRVTRAVTQLHDGDRLLIGTTELSLFATRRRRISDRPTARPQRAPSLPFSKMQKPDSVPTTGRADAIEVIGKVAARHAANGNVAEAVRVLSGHLNKVLLGATAGLAVPEALLDRATHFGIELFRWTNNVAWLDYVIELHLAVQRVPSENSLALLEGVLRDHTIRFDRMLLVYLVERLDAKKDGLSQPERWRLLRLERITRYS